jgi:hypothetical protein
MNLLLAFSCFSGALSIYYTRLFFLYKKETGNIDDIRWHLRNTRSRAIGSILLTLFFLLLYLKK